jgi:hypothetical protein
MQYDDKRAPDALLHVIRTETTPSGKMILTPPEMLTLASLHYHADSTGVCRASVRRIARTANHMQSLAQTLISAKESVIQ